MKTLIASVMVVALAAPALATEFYIVRDTTTKKCTIVEQRPTTSTVVVMGNGKVYTTRAEAETAIKTVCVE